MVLASARTFTVARYKAQWLFPSGRLARVAPTLRVRHESPGGGCILPGGLRHVAGFPDLGLLCPIRPPIGIRLSPAYLPAPCSKIPPESTPSLDSSPPGVPLRRLHLLTSFRSLGGFPGALPSLFLQATALRTPAGLHPLALAGASVLPSVHVNTLGVRNKLFRRCPRPGGERGLPYGLQDALGTLAPFLVHGLRRSAPGPPLDTGGG